MDTWDTRKKRLARDDLAEIEHCAVLLAFGKYKHLRRDTRKSREWPGLEPGSPVEWCATYLPEDSILIWSDIFYTNWHIYIYILYRLVRADVFVHISDVWHISGMWQISGSEFHGTISSASNSHAYFSLSLNLTHGNNCTCFSLHQQILLPHSPTCFSHICAPFHASFQT